MGTMTITSYGEGYRSLADDDPDKADYKARLFAAADRMATRYQSSYQAIESWDWYASDEVIVDNMMSNELLFWAAANGAPNAASLQQIATNHALTTMENHVRADGSTYHVVKYDRTTGDIVYRRSHQGYATESTWARGQSWAIYGFTMAYRYTGDQRLLDTAVLTAEWWLDHVPAGGLAPYDYTDPDPSKPTDSSASAVVASALLELMHYVDPIDSDRYFQAAETHLATLSGLDVLTNDLANWDSILREGTYNNNEDENRQGLIWGDYYYLEALGRYREITCAGDADLDGDVDLRDASALLSGWGSDEAGWYQADFNGDGLVDEADAQILLANWGRGLDQPVPAPKKLVAIVPEPATLALLGLGGLAMLRRRRAA